MKQVLVINDQMIIINKQIQNLRANTTASNQTKRILCNNFCTHQKSKKTHFHWLSHRHNMRLYISQSDFLITAHARRQLLLFFYIIINQQQNIYCHLCFFCNIFLFIYFSLSPLK